MNETYHRKYCEACDKQVHTSSFAKHLKSKLHLQKNVGVIPQEPRVLLAVEEQQEPRVLPAVEEQQEPRVLPVVEEQQQPRARPIPPKRNRRNIEIIIKIEK